MYAHYVLPTGWLLELQASKFLNTRCNFETVSFNVAWDRHWQLDQTRGNSQTFVITSPRNELGICLQHKLLFRFLIKIQSFMSASTKLWLECAKSCSTTDTEISVLSTFHDNCSRCECMCVQQCQSQHLNSLMLILLIYLPDANTLEIYIYKWGAKKKKEVLFKTSCKLNMKHRHGLPITCSVDITEGHLSMCKHRENVTFIL